MKLFELIKNIDVKNIDKLDLNVEIKNISNKAQNKTYKGLFFCYDGATFKSEDCAKLAEHNGAVAIVCEKYLKDIKCQQVIVQDIRMAMSIIAKNFYNILDDLIYIGVTGTNGKTTTTTVIKQILDFVGKPAGLIGTEGCYFLDKKIDRGLTTPDPIELFSIISQMQNAGIKYVVMEVSAHAIALKKIAGIKFDTKILSNITQDHLDYFLTMENYAKTKLAFFEDDCKKIINLDEQYANQIKNNKNITYFTLNNVTNENIDNLSNDIVSVNEIQENGSKFSFIFGNRQYTCINNFKGQYNVYNLISAIICCSKLDIEIYSILSAIKTIRPVAGRLNCYNTSDEKFVVIDFAHTPDGLQKVLTTLRPMVKNRLICIFGCGGNRDPLKRPIMGKISEDFADFVIITNDNPRFEKEADITKQIKNGMKKDNHKVIFNRGDAIKYASIIARRGDIIVICGKGAEDYQDINGIKYPYKDLDEVKKYFDISE